MNLDAEPFLKWAGGKRNLLRELKRHVPARMERYFEPFVGGGALYFDLASRGKIPTDSVISDASDHLINTYQAVRDNPEAVIRVLARLDRDHDEELFYEVRAKFDKGSSEVRAARMIYLNRTCFNGLWRVNRAGEFNVPLGKFAKRPPICEPVRLRTSSLALRMASVAKLDFEDALKHAGKGDFVYIDPPYWPLSKTSSFTRYSEEDFGPKDHVRLCDVARQVKARGATVLISNADVPEVFDMYIKHFSIRRVEGTRMLSSKVSRRQPARELLIWG